MRTATTSEGRFLRERAITSSLRAPCQGKLGLVLGEVRLVKELSVGGAVGHIQAVIEVKVVKDGIRDLVEAPQGWRFRSNSASTTCLVPSTPWVC